VNKKQSIILSLSILILVSLFFFVVFGEKGWIDLNIHKKEKLLLLEQNYRLEQKNLALSRTIDRLKNDLSFIESVARQELGMIGKDELIFKFKQDENRND
jgi:cell division protein FtsB